MRGVLSFFQGDIVLVEFPFTDLVTFKLRPAIVVSSELVNKSDNVVLSPVTITIRNDNFSLILKDKDLTRSLDGESEIRCNTFVTFQKSKIKKKISALRNHKHPVLYEKIISSFKVPAN